MGRKRKPRCHDSEESSDESDNGDDSDKDETDSDYSEESRTRAVAPRMRMRRLTSMARPATLLAWPSSQLRQSGQITGRFPV